MSNETTTVQPPTRLSALILLAIKDGRALPATHEPDSGVGHEPVTSPSDYADWYLEGRPDAELPVCRVDLAGAVMSGTLRLDPYVEGRPEDFPQAWNDALFALTQVRVGDWAGAESMLRGEGLPREESDVLKRIPRPEKYRYRDRVAFAQHLESLEKRAGTLAAAGF